MTKTIEQIIKRVDAILNEASVTAKTGRTRPDVGRVPEGASIASLIDHTMLKPETTARQIEKLCFEAKEYGFASVCVNSAYVPLACELLRDSDVSVCAAVGFPLGATLPHVKAFEAQQALEAGATEIDMVINIGQLKNRDLVSLHDDITEVAHVAHEHDGLLKVIIEAALLTDEEKVIACQVAKRAGADFVKTSTGFSVGGAQVEDVLLMRKVVGEGMGVKAAGGIRSLEDAQTMVRAGANRVGASAGVQIAQQESGTLITSGGNDTY